MQHPEFKKIDILLEFAVAFHKYGMNSFRLEAALISMGKSMGLNSSFYCTPTMIIGTFDTSTEQGQISRHVRVGPGDTHLGKLCEVDALADRMVYGQEDLNIIHNELENCLKSRDPYSLWTRSIAFCISSFCFSFILSRRWQDALISSFLGLIVSLIDWYGSKNQKLGQLKNLVSAMAVSLIACTIYHFSKFPFNLPISILAGLLHLLPGLTLTVAMAELAMNHLASGTARMMGAITTLLQLAFGTMIGIQIFFAGKLNFPTMDPNIPKWVLYPVLLASGLGMGVLFKARKKDLWRIVMAAIVGLVGTKIGHELLGREMGAFMGGFCAGTFSNLMARIQNLPVTLFLLPGITLSVPGSFGLKSASSFFTHNPDVGITQAGAALLIAISLVAGLLIGNLLINPRRNL